VGGKKEKRRGVTGLVEKKKLDLKTSERLWDAYHLHSTNMGGALNRFAEGNTGTAMWSRGNKCITKTTYSLLQGYII